LEKKKLKVSLERDVDKVSLKRDIVMETRFKKKSQIVDIGITAVAVVLSIGTMLYGVNHFGLSEA